MLLLFNNLILINCDYTYDYDGRKQFKNSEKIVNVFFFFPLAVN